jgi:dipeptidyl aminopeptidase/acylaminoacyl peptidase
MRKHAAILIALLLPPAAAAQGPPTPGPQDVPQAVPASGTLAGDPRPDISRFLNVRRTSNEQLSPDGNELLYVTSTTGHPQLWATGGACQAPRQLTFLDSSVTFADWSPSGEWIAYGTDRAGDEREGFYLISSDGMQERELLAPSAAYRAWGGWSRDGRRVAFSSTERNGIDYDIYVMDVRADGSHSEPRRALEGKGGLYVAAWRPDGGALLLTQARGEADQDVFLLDLASGKLETIFQPADAASYSSFSFAPDGRTMYLATNQDRDLAGLAVFDFASRKLAYIETPPHEVEDVALSRDGRWLAWCENQNGFGALRVRDLAGKRDVAIKEGLPAGIYSLRWAERAPRLRVHVESPAVAGDAWVLDPSTGASARWTESARGGLDPASFVEPEAVSFKSFDGETLFGLLYLPKGLAAGAKPPVLLGVHGGPTGQARPDYDAAFQYLLTRGIAVFDLNFRGSTGYGKRFTRLDNGRLRPNAVKDMAAALDWLASTGRVDASRAAVMGGSYGGYMTFAAMTQLPDRFKAGVGFVGVSNWLTALEGASPALKASDRIEYGNVGDPGERAFFVEISPITHVKNVRAPLMVLHGANDPRDPVSEADQLVAAIRAQGGEVEYLRFPDEGHGIRKLSNRIVAYRRIAAFLERHLGLAT